MDGAYRQCYSRPVDAPLAGFVALGALPIGPFAWRRSDMRRTNGSTALTNASRRALPRWGTARPDSKGRACASRPPDVSIASPPNSPFFQDTVLFRCRTIRRFVQHREPRFPDDQTSVYP